MRRKTGKPARRGRWRGAMTEYRLLPLLLKGGWKTPSQALQELRERDVERPSAREFDPAVVLGLGRYIIAEFSRSFRMADTALAYERDLRSFFVWFSAYQAGRPLRQPLTEETRNALAAVAEKHLDDVAAAKMGVRQAQALRLRIRGLNGREIAQEMGCTELQARNALYIARRVFSAETLLLEGDQLRAFGGV